MTKKQKQAAISTFKNELRTVGWTEDRHGNFMAADKQHRVQIATVVWREQEKRDKVWVNVRTHPLNELAKGCAPLPPIKAEDKPKGVKRTPKGNPNVTAKEAERSTEPIKVMVTLDPASTRKIDAMSFKQIQTGSRMDTLEKTMAKLAGMVEGMAGMVNEQLRRIKSPPVLATAPVFYHKLFSSVTMRLRKKSIDVVIVDVDSGVKRRRVFRCSDWTRVEHLISYRTLTDGIEELEARPPVKRKAKPPTNKKKSKKFTKRIKTLEETRYEMERDGIANRELPGPNVKAARYYDPKKAEVSEAVNRTRAKAEKVITKICSPGGVAAGAKDKELIDALEANGFSREVAFYAAMNCGRIVDPKVIRDFEKKGKSKAKAPVATSNEY